MTTIICTELYPIELERTGAGLTTAVRALVEGALGQGADIRQVIRFRPLLTATGLTVPRVRQVGPLPVLDAPRIGTRYCFSPQLTRFALARAGRVQTADVVVCHTATSFAIARRVFATFGAHFIHVVHACDLGHHDLPFALANADAVYCRSEALRWQLLQRYGFTARGVVSSGIDAADFGSPRKPLDDGPLRMVVAATLTPQRQVGAVLDALALVSDRVPFRLDLFGDGPLLGDIIAAVQRHGLASRVRLHGFRPRAEVLQTMREAHLFLMPSVRETFGLAYLEAMAQGCVVVGHRGWGIDGIVEDGHNGYLVDAAEPALIADKLLAYLNSDREALHQGAFNTARDHTADAAAANYARMIESMSTPTATSPHESRSAHHGKPTGR